MLFQIDFLNWFGWVWFGFSPDYCRKTCCYFFVNFGFNNCFVGDEVQNSLGLFNSMYQIRSSRKRRPSSLTLYVYRYFSVGLSFYSMVFSKLKQKCIGNAEGTKVKWGKGDGRNERERAFLSELYTSHTLV